MAYVVLNGVNSMSRHYDRSPVLLSALPGINPVSFTHLAHDFPLLLSIFYKNVIIVVEIVYCLL